MKNIDFFEALITANADCRFASLPSSYSWNDRFKWNYYYRVIDSGDGTYEIFVYRSDGFEFQLLYIVYLSVIHGLICVSDILYSPQSVDRMKFSSDELKKTVPFLLGKFRNYSIFLVKLSMAAKVLDKEFF